MIPKGIGLQDIHLEDLRKVSIPIPPLEELQQIVEEVDRRLSVVDEIEVQVDANLKRATRLRQGILKRAFQGSLVPQDPPDEPADSLVKRIRQQHQAAAAVYNGRLGTSRATRSSRTSAPPLPFLIDDGNDQGGKP